jgi:hypothetical protein
MKTVMEQLDELRFDVRKLQDDVRRLKLGLKPVRRKYT